jgi:hypothetical protein
MSHDTEWVTRYLDDQADRVVVDDLLYEIEHEITPTYATTETAHHPRRLSILVAIAATIAMVAIGASVLRPKSVPYNDGFAAAPSDSVAVPVVSTDPPITEATTPPTTVPANQLPPGGIGLAGQTPSCTMLESDVYSCTLSGPYDPAGDRVYPNFIVTYYTDSTLRVAGGCRSITTDARRWVCFVGERAVAEGTITATGVGQLYLGQPALNEYSAG